MKPIHIWDKIIYWWVTTSEAWRFTILMLLVFWAMMFFLVI